MSLGRPVCRGTPASGAICVRWGGCLAATQLFFLQILRWAPPVPCTPGCCRRLRTYARSHHELPQRLRGRPATSPAGPCAWRSSSRDPSPLEPPAGPPTSSYLPGSVGLAGLLDTPHTPALPGNLTCSELAGRLAKVGTRWTFSWAQLWWVSGEACCRMAGRGVPHSSGRACRSRRVPPPPRAGGTRPSGHWYRCLGRGSSGQSAGESRGTLALPWGAGGRAPASPRSTRWVAVGPVP